MVACGMIASCQCAANEQMRRAREEKAAEEAKEKKKKEQKQIINNDTLKLREKKEQIILNNFKSNVMLCRNFEDLKKALLALDYELEISGMIDKNKI